MQSDPKTHQPGVVKESGQPALDVDEKHTEHIADGEDDNDTNSLLSAYDSLTASNFTTSLAASITNYKYENGRRYHAYREGEYVLPNDELEQERLDLHHHMWRLLLGGKLYTAPIPPDSPPQRILDLGTGTGIWAIDMADEFPEAQVQGIDLSPIQPTWVPPNCTFHVDDYDGDWTYDSKNEPFDFIHGRALSGTSNDWSKFYRQVYQNLKPGGYVEMQEYDAWIFSDDDSCDRAPWTMQWVNKIDAASKGFNKQLNVAKFQKQWMDEAGFVDVEEMVYKVPIGPYSTTSTISPHLRELGQAERIHMQMSVEAHTPALFTRILGYTQEECRDFMEHVKSEFRDENLRLYTVYRFIVGRRPGEGKGNEVM